jgi:hypothetical protein
VGDEGAVWANDINGNVYHVGDNENQVWTTVDGNLVQLDVGSDRVVGVNNWGEIFFRELAKTDTGGSWKQVNGHLKQASTSQNHVTWGVDTQNSLWFFADHPTGDNQPIAPEPTAVFWLPVHYATEEMEDLDVGRDGMVWACTESGEILHRVGISDDNISGTQWVKEEVPRRCQNVAVCTSGHVWAVTPMNEVIFRTGIIASSID